MVTFDVMLLFFSLSAFLWEFLLFLTKMRGQKKSRQSDPEFVWWQLWQILPQNGTPGNSMGFPLPASSQNRLIKALVTSVHQGGRNVE